MDWKVRTASLILCLGILLATIQDGIAERRIVCYYTNWSVYRPGTAKFSPQNVNPYLCTHLIYAFGGFTKENALKPFDKYQDIEKGGYAKFTGLKTYNKNLKTMLAIGGWNEGSSRFSPMVADPGRRREFVKNAVKFLRQNHFDGLDLDWEYPAFRDGGKPRDKDNYANLVQELGEEFERESSKTGRPRLLLSMAMPAGIEYIDKGYDVPRLNEYLDFINLLSYDYHSAYEPAVNHHSPLYPLEEDNEYNYDAELTIDYTITHLLEKGASADKVVLGIPTYGRSYTLFNQDATELGSPADGPGTEGEATREKGYLAYYEICESVAGSDEWEVVQPNPKAMGPYAFKGDQWVGYDDEDIVRSKARYVNEKKLGGIMFWSIDNDDFRGKCHGRPYPLIEAAKEALLADDSRNTIDKTKSTDGRKKTRTQGTQSNTRKLGTSSRRSGTTSAPIASKRASSSRPKYRTISQASNEEQEDREVSRRSYDPSSDEDAEGRNTVRVIEKVERPKNRNRSKTRSASANRSTRRKQSGREGQSKTGEDEQSLSNKLTTPEPPTTPDPGTDFKCEDDGFFPHPRDCKKYFWCLDSGPSGLGVVAHQFTCPSGLVFNKAADSCDYPRNVICPKALKASIVSTTKSPITAATSRTTYLHSTTTAKTESEEYDDSEEAYGDDETEESEEEEEEEEVKKEPKSTTTAKPLVYKTLTRNRPSATTTTTTTSRPIEPERVINNEDEEDPKVIKELIDLIKKAGGIEELEKQLLFQEKNSDTRSGSESVTQATISRSLYERVLSRQANRIGSQRPALVSSETSYVNGPGRAQFEGLDDIPEVKSLRRSQKPQYVTIARSKSVAKESSSENEDVNEDDEDNDSTDVASSEEKSVSNPLEGSSSTQRVTPSYVNIRRTRLSTTTSRTENDVEGKDVEGKDVETEEERPTRRRRPFVSSKQQDSEASSEASKPSRNRGSSFRNSEKRDGSKNTNRSTEKDDDPTTKSRYTNIHRFRSTTSRTSEDLSGAVPSSEVAGKTVSPTRLEEYSEVSRTTAGTTDPTSATPAATTSTSTEVITVISVEPPENPSSVSPKVDTVIGSTTDSVKLVEDSATEILFTTLPATSSSSSQSTTTTTTTTTLASRSTIAAVSQPRPFGFTRRRSGSSEATTTATTPLSRSKVADSETIRLPTLKELIGYPTTYHDDRVATTSSSILLHLLRNDVDNDISRQNVEESLRGTDESQVNERELARGVTEETDDSLLLQASENRARSRSPKREDVANPDERVSVTNAIQEDESKREVSPTSIYPKPTTMRGIPLASLTPGPEMRGFYITRGESGLPSSILADSFTLSYTTTDSVKQQTETTLIPDIFTTDEIFTVARHDRGESGPNAPDDRVNDIINDTGGEKFSTSSSSVSSISSRDSDYTENLLNREKSDVITAPIGRPASKGGKSLGGSDHNTTPLSNPYAVSPTTPTRRRIALAVSRYNEAVTPLWAGRRVVKKKRNRTAASPIKDAIRQTEVDSAHTTTGTLNEPSLTSKFASTLTSRRRKPATTMPTLIVPNSAAFPEILNAHNNHGSSNGTKTEGPEGRTIVDAATSTNSIIAATPSISEVVSTTNDYPTAADVSTFSNDSTTVTVPAIANATIITTAPSTVAAAKTPAIGTDATITATSATISTGVETILPNYSVTDNPTSIENTNAIPTDSVITAAFAASAETEIAPTNVDPIDPATTQAIATDLAITTEPTVAGTGVETATTMTDHSGITLPAAASTRETATDSANMATGQIADADTGATSTIADHSAVEIPTTITTPDVATDPAIAAAVETASTIGGYLASSATTATENTRVATTIPATTSPLIAAISSTVNTHMHATTPMTTRNLADTSIVNTANTITTIAPLNVIIPTIADLNVITTSANANVPSISAISDTSSATTQSRISSAGSSEAPITGTVTSTSPAAPTTLTAESSTIPFANPSTFNISSNSEIPAVTTTAESTQTAEVPMTFVASPIITSTTTAFPKSLPSTNFEAPSVVTVALSTKENESPSTPMTTQTPSTLFFTTTPTTNEATVALEESTASATLSATSGESIATNPTIQTTMNAYESDSIPTIGEESVTERKVDLTETTSMETESQIKDQTTTTINKPSSTRTTSDESTTSEIRLESEEVTSKAIETHERNQTTSELDAINHQFSRKGSRRRVLNRTNNWLGGSVTPQRTNQYPRHRITVHRGRSRRPPTNTSSRAIEENRRRRITRKRIRINSEAINSTIRPDRDTDVQNTTEDHAVYDRVENVRRRMEVVTKKRVEGEMTTILPTEETMVFLQSTAIENETLQAHHENGNIEKKEKIVLKKIKQSQGSLTTKQTNTNSASTNDSTNESLPNNSLSNLHMDEDFSEHEKSRKIMRVVLKNVRPKSAEKHPIEEAIADSDSIDKNLQDNFSKSPYADENLSDKKIARRRMRVVLKSVWPKSEEKNSTIKETNVDSDFTEKNLQDNLLNNFNISQNFSTEEKTRKRMRIILKSVRPKYEEKNSTIEEANADSNLADKNLQSNLPNNFDTSQKFSNEEKTRKMNVMLKRVKPKSEGGTKTEEANTEYNSTNESLQGDFSTNFRSNKNLPVEYGTRKRTRVVLKSVKPKSEERNSTIEETRVHPDSNESLQSTFSNNFRSGKNLLVKYETGRRTRVVLKSVKPKSEERNSIAEETSVRLDSINESLQSTFPNNFHSDKNLPVEHGTGRRTRIVLKSVKPKSEERISTIEEISVDPDSTDQDLQGSFSSNLHMNENLSDEEEARRRMEIITKGITSILKPKFKERDSVTEGTSTDSDFARKDPRVLFTFNISSNLHVGDNLADKEKTMTHSKSEEKEATTEWPEDTEPQITGTSVPAEEDTDRPSLEVTNGGSASRKSGSRHPNRHRKPTQFTTTAPLTNTLSNTLTIHRRRRPPVETTLSPRIDLVDAFEGTESYVKPAAVLHDQNADVSDQSIRAQEFAVTLSDPPSSSSDIGRTPLRDADRRKISTTVAPKTDPTTGRTVSRYDADFRSRQRPRTKDRPTANATTRPRRPPVTDYDYYEDLAPIVAGKSALNSKLSLTSKGAVRCLDQGNFPHPYSCKKFITCARMVNGQVIGTEYTCPDKLTFDPVGGICNWSAGLGCKD